MRFLTGSLFVLMLLVALAPETAVARLFRRSNRSRSNYSTTYSASTTTTSSATSEEVANAQGVATIMARLNRVGHFGGNPGYEGCGCGSTPQAAYSVCCYSNSGMATVDVGYAQGSNGMWYCCRRYR